MRGKPFRIRVEGSGMIAAKYRIYNADTGEEIPNVTHLSIDFDPAAQLVTAEMTLVDLEVEIDDVPVNTSVKGGE